MLPGRERDTTAQLIGKIDEVVEVIRQLSSGSIDWAEACQKLPAYSGEQDLS
jgi:glycyl-tRNA synthetase